MYQFFWDFNYVYNFQFQSICIYIIMYIIMFKVCSWCYWIWSNVWNTEVIWRHISEYVFVCYGHNSSKGSHCLAHKQVIGMQKEYAYILWSDQDNI